MKEKINQKGFIPLLIIIIASIVVASVGTGVVLQRQGKLAPFIANIAEVFEGTEEEIAIKDTIIQEVTSLETQAEDAQIKAEQAELEAEQLQKEIETIGNEAEKAKLLAEIEKAKADAEKAKLEAERAKAEVERLKKETEELKKESIEAITQLSITNISPNQILNYTDNNLTISGSGIQPGAELYIGDIDFGSGVVVDDNALIINISSRTLMPGTYSVKVVNYDGGKYILYNALTVTSASPQLDRQQEETPEAPYDLVSIIKQWKPIVGYVECEFRSASNVLQSGSSGSGIALDPSNQPICFATNEHVITDDWDNGAYACSIKLPGTNYLYSSEGQWEGIYTLASGEDGGIVYIDNPDSYISDLTSSFPKSCTRKPFEGEEIIVLGYPIIGSKDNITVTKGIISGFEGDYFITDAKIDQGNSGGAAILLKDNCLLGIPTYAIVGTMESLGRVLNISALIE